MTLKLKVKVTIVFVALPIYTQIPNLKGLTKLLSYHVQKEISVGATAAAAA